MGVLSKIELEIISNYIESHFNQPKTELGEFLHNSLHSFLTLFDNKYSDLELMGALTGKSGFEKFIKHFNKYIDIKTHQGIKNKVRIFEDNNIYYIKKTEFGKNVHYGNRKWLFEMLERLRVEDNSEKGTTYEQFCTNFLIDIGLSGKYTKKSRDEGIDIIGKIQCDYSETTLAELVLGNQIHLLAQVKYHEKPVDKSIIKHIIGDSLFYRFSPSAINLRDEIMYLSNHPIYLMVFSHKGFTNEAIDFAKKHGVITVDSNMIVDILCSLDKNWNSLESVKMFK